MDKTVVLITVGVVISKDLQSLSFLTLADKVPRRLGCEPDEKELRKGDNTLEDRWNSPCPIAANVLTAESRPRSAEMESIEVIIAIRR